FDGAEEGFDCGVVGCCLNVDCHDVSQNAASRAVSRGQNEVGRVDVDLADLDGAVRCTVIGRYDAEAGCRASGVRRKQIRTGIVRTLGGAAQLVDHDLDFGLDLFLVGSARSDCRNNLFLDLVYDFDRLVHGGVSRVDLASAEAQSVLNGRVCLVVGTHRGRDRPVSSVVGGFANAQTGGNTALSGFQRPVRRSQVLESGQ